MSHAFQINPREVLGVSENASLADLHNAYRTKSKTYHPDVGGEEWAFRVLTRAYEILSTARVMGRADEEMRREDSAREHQNATADRPSRPSAEAGPNPFARVRPDRTPSRDGTSRQGVRDPVAEPGRLVGLEMLLLRFELEGPLGLLAGAPEDRNLSCSLHIAWPVDESTKPRIDPDRVAASHNVLMRAFEAARSRVPPISAEGRVEGERFVGLLSYNSALQADEAFKVFRKSLLEKGYGVSQTIRDLTIPRAWRT